MNLYQFNTDNLDRRGFISKESILSIVSQEEIFKLVFGFLPVEFDLVHSPLRKDRVAGCWFEYHMDKLRFIDFANSNTYKGIKLSNMDCFDMVQVYFDIPNFYLTLEYIHNSLIRGNESLRPILEKKEISKEVKPKVKILIESRPFNIADKNYWSQYGIRKQNLIEDKVFSVKKFYALNTKSGHIISECNDLAYSYNDFPDSRKKLYFPIRKGKNRFLTNCTKNDIGGINSLIVYGKELIISKSYKDYRVLKNNGKNVIWFQNEGMIPNDTILNNLVKHFEKVIVWFDNDQAGITASEKIKNHINSIIPSKAQNLWLPERGLEVGIKDPSDCIAKDKQYFYKFLKDFTK